MPVGLTCHRAVGRPRGDGCASLVEEDVSCLLADFILRQLLNFTVIKAVPLTINRVLAIRWEEAQDCQTFLTPLEWLQKNLNLSANGLWSTAIHTTHALLSLTGKTEPEVARIQPTAYILCFPLSSTTTQNRTPSLGVALVTSCSVTGGSLPPSVNLLTEPSQDHTAHQKEKRQTFSRLLCETDPRTKSLCLWLL